MPDGTCPYPNMDPLTVKLRTYFISDYALKIFDARDGTLVWKPAEVMFFTNRKWQETICLDTTENMCYEFLITDANGEGLLDGSYELWWDHRTLIRRGYGAFGSSDRFRFGKGCASLSESERANVQEKTEL